MSARLPATLFLIAIIFSASAQFRVNFKNAVFPEIGGNGVGYSLNYERMLARNIPVRVGIAGAQRLAAIPFLTGVLLGRGMHHLQFMAGVTYIRNMEDLDAYGTSIPDHEFPLTASIGYRYQQRGDRLLFYFAYTPLFRDTFTPSAGIACGYRFN
jgi:hypothetical protein